MVLPPRTDIYLDNTDPNCLIITGTDLSADPDWFSGKNKVVVRCMSLTLPAEISWKNGNLLLVVGTLVCQSNGSSIIVDGKNGKGFGSASAASGASPGANGGNGKNGSQGSDGGTINIVASRIAGDLSLYARGGNGGDAQSGGNGANGKNAVKPSCNNNKGAAAGKGGNAGKAGTPGNGGNGGSIELICGEIDGRPPILDVSSGQPGKSAQHGKPGKGGSAAAGTTCYSHSFRLCMDTI